ncbi:MAG: hypothetical protein LBF16_05775 [Pseudomonadales bacterium]|jgi:hypothetical protein|nr:hypothetical protein [Pseudomonadales bacterium]
MNQARTQRKPVATPEKNAAANSRVFKFSFKDVPVVDAAMEARLEAAARVPRKDRLYPVIIEAPDA